MPKDFRSTNRNITNTKKTIDNYYKTLHCKVCKIFSQTEICPQCLMNKERSLLTINMKLRSKQSRLKELFLICQNCSSVRDELVECSSMDCPVYFIKVKELQKVKGLDQEYKTIIETLSTEN